MKPLKLAILSALIAAGSAGLATAQRGMYRPLSEQPAASDYRSYYAHRYSSQGEDEEASPSDRPVEDNGLSALGDECEVGCDDCGSSAYGPQGHCCAVADPWRLFPEGSLPCAIDVGGWWQFGYTDEGNGLFNNHPDRFNLHQGWLYAERVADGSDCRWDWGFRVDVLYGVDTQDTQSFGNEPGRFDFLNGFDHGIYGWAIPQLYGEVAYGDLSVKLGHFYTIVGYEVAAAPRNFFYSHALAFILSEPFTHTGALAQYSLTDDLALYGGWTLGWDTGFDQSDGGNNFLGGFSTPLLDRVKFAYVTTIGNFGHRGNDAYMHSLVFDADLTERWQYVLQSNLLRVDETGEDSIGINQYVFYTVSDCIQLGARVEWFQADDVTAFTFAEADGVGRIAAVPPGTHAYYEATFGVNIKPHRNFIIRPEVRHDWAPVADFDETIFGIDLIGLW